MFDINFAELLTFASLTAFLTLASLEIVLGIDNIVFIAILTGKLPPEQQSRARKLGLLGAMGMRIVMLLGLGFIMGLTKPLFTFWGHEYSWKSVILIVGGLFLVAKATYEIHHRIGPDAEGTGPKKRVASFSAAIAQIMMIDIIFSLDSVITAVGMAKHIEIMIAAVVVSVIVMMLFADPISHFIEKNPTVKMLALAFLVLIGVMLIADGMGHHVPKGYIYFAIAFSLFVEFLNIAASRRKKVAHKPGTEAGMPL
ncbi:MAG: TerC family protein [Phycisphaerae bacterium]